MLKFTEEFIQSTKFLAFLFIIVGVGVFVVALNNTFADEGSLNLNQLFDIPVAYAHFSDDFPLECGLFPDLEQCDKSLVHEIRDWIYDFLFNLFADQINPLN